MCNHAMLNITILASGSSGNTLLVQAEGCAVLVDAGLSARRISALLSTCGLRMEDLSGILLTHEHGDHAKALKVIAAKTRIPIFTTPLTAQSLRRSGVEASWSLFASGAGFTLGVFDIFPFSVPHDAADPVGFVLKHETRSFAVLTDLGYATRHVVESVRGVDALLIETNHDETLLQQDAKRPWSVKQRILSRHGHLSNAAAAEIVAQVATDALCHVMLGHLSKDCNSSDLALETVGAKLQNMGRNDIKLQCVHGNTDAPLAHMSF